MTTPDLSQLTDSGDILDLDDGRRLRLLIEPDDIDPFAEFDVYGKAASVGGRTNDYGYHVRPHGFNGNAEKIWISGDQVWWQPPDDVKRTDEGFDEFRSHVIELLTFGMTGVVLEVLQGEDAYSRPIVVKVASLWGIDSLDNGYLAEVLGELYEEVMS